MLQPGVPLPVNEVVGVPQFTGFGFPEVISAGTALRGKKYISIAELVHSMAYTPPPLTLKPVPKDLVSEVLNPHPTVPSPGVLQLAFCKTEPDEEPLLVIEQPAEVWRVMESVAAKWTPSMISISPLEGQLGPKVQKAGHTPQMPPGM